MGCSTLKHANGAITRLMRSVEGPIIEFVFPGVTYIFPGCFHFQERPLIVSPQEVVKHSDLFSSLAGLDKEAKSRTKTVLSLFDEEEEKTEDHYSIQPLKKEVGKVSKRIRESYFMISVLSCELLRIEGSNFSTSSSTFLL